MRPIRRCLWIQLFVASTLLVLSSAAQAELKSSHWTMKSPKAQANREEVFKLLMTGTTPSWLQGKPSRVVTQRTDAMREAILEQGRKVVKAIVAKPAGKPSIQEQKILGLLSPSQRATLLKEEAGFHVEKVKFLVGGKPTDKYKITLKRFGFSEYGGDAPAQYTAQMSVYNRVMSPNTITYAPAGGHSKYVSQGQVLDLYFGTDYGTLRPNSKPLFPTWMSDSEGSRMKTIFDVGNASWNSSMGTKMSHGRPGMWPPVQGQRQETGNSCTTTFIRAPIGDRQADYAWIDALQGKVAAAAKGGKLRIDGVDLTKQTLLEALTGKSPADTQRVFAAIQKKLPAEARNLTKLKGEVDFFYGQLKTKPDPYSYGSSNTAEKCTFPLDLMHRTPLSTLARIAGDPVGPGMATQKFRAADPARLGVVTVFEKAPPGVY